MLRQVGYASRLQGKQTLARQGTDRGQEDNPAEGPDPQHLMFLTPAPASPDGSSLKRTSFLTASTENSAFPEKFYDKRVMHAWRSGASVMSESL